MDGFRAFCAQHRLHFGGRFANFGEMLVNITRRNREADKLVGREKEVIGLGGVVVESLESLAPGDLMAQEFMCRELRKRHLILFAAGSGELVDLATKPPDDPQRLLLRRVIEAVKKWEGSAQVRMANRANGSHGSRPYGAYEHEAEILGWMRQLHTDGLSCEKIGVELRRKNLKTRTGKSWDKKNVYSILYGRDLKKNNIRKLETIKIPGTT